jgi:hypothetical protein
VPRSQDQVGLSQFQRIQDLESTLVTVERWLAIFDEMTFTDWLGINVESFSQFTHCLVILFKLSTFEEPGWDLGDIKRRADVFVILDRAYEIIINVPAAVGIVDADGPRKGLFFKSAFLFRAIKALFLAEMPPKLQTGDLQTPESNALSESLAQFGPGPTPDEVSFNLSTEPWLSDIFDYAWDISPETISFTT